MKQKLEERGQLVPEASICDLLTRASGIRRYHGVRNTPHLESHHQVKLRYRFRVEICSIRLQRHCIRMIMLKGPKGILVSVHSIDDFGTTQSEPL